MQFHSHRSGRPGRIVLGLTVTATLAAALAACSASGGTTTNAAAKPASAATGAAAPAPSATASVAAAADAGLSGRWSGQYSGAYQGTFTLRWRQSGSGLSGHIRLSDPAQTLSLHGRVSGGVIKFGTVGSTAITYSGSVSGNSMSGTWQIHSTAGSAGGHWSAARS